MELDADDLPPASGGMDAAAWPANAIICAVATCCATLGAPEPPTLAAPTLWLGRKVAGGKPNVAATVACSLASLRVRPVWCHRQDGLRNAAEAVVKRRAS